MKEQLPKGGCVGIAMAGRVGMVIVNLCCEDGANDISLESSDFLFVVVLRKWHHVLDRKSGGS